MPANQRAEREVFVLGAGFTRAFVPGAPLLVDRYEMEPLVKMFRQFSKASWILEHEQKQAPPGRVNIERLMTRLDSLMPYDYDRQATDEFALLLSEIRRMFVSRLNDAGKGNVHQRELAKFGRYCLDRKAHCVTFNYDDVLDAALYRLNRFTWNPDGGYGFFCRSAALTIQETQETSNFTQLMWNTGIQLLKLHGSINWFPRRGYPKPYVIDAIVHYEPWYPQQPPMGTYPYPTDELIRAHLEPEPFIVPPVLVKSTLVEQPILRMVWNRAFEVLRAAHRVTFIGYSFPVTDIAVTTLFGEALEDFPPENIHIVNLATTRRAQNEVKRAYRDRLGRISDSNFSFGGALEWVQSLPEKSP